MYLFDTCDVATLFFVFMFLYIFPLKKINEKNHSYDLVYCSFCSFLTGLFNSKEGKVKKRPMMPLAVSIKYPKQNTQYFCIFKLHQKQLTWHFQLKNYRCSKFHQPWGNLEPPYFF